MTLPNERTRAIIQTEAFLIELSKDKSICDEKRQEARRLLRHYPSRKEMLLADYKVAKRKYLVEKHEIDAKSKFE